MLKLLCTAVTPETHASPAEVTSPEVLPADTALSFLSVWADETDPAFLTYIRRRWLVGPSAGPVNIPNLRPGTHFSEVGQSQLVDKVRVQLSIHLVVED